MADVTLPDLVGFMSFNGIQVCPIGEEDDYVALGHHDPRTTLEAFNRLALWLGFDDVAEGKVLPDGLPPVQQRWAVLREDACAEAGDPAHNPHCAECREIAGGGWWLDWAVGEDIPGAFPIMALIF
jgi:hypothetical protein